ncbi:protein-disulfide reductase DsbD family protein [Polaribacter sp. HL-MS24]|uniref:protein-disulfide reductase DsbD family protein n=1 Tax=Polaribacter sp. HL-MS24 TaxID=3077735 RepID=UPI0029342A75|nr:cytochrome c biogenesis protein CcdA [Polaribacter sp. HL-MS24]WOC39462.1 cytochrome c biogenesis protein CcdA [Polaribacter sp. HL-MS24]
MKKLLLACLLCFSMCINAQTEETPVVWKTSIEKINDSIYDLTFTGAILDNWYVFSQYNPEEASLPMVISIPEGETGFKLLGKARESATKKKYSAIWEVDEIIFTKKAIVTQRIEVTNREITQVKLNLFGQVCETACIQFEDTYAFSLNGSAIQKQVIEVDSKSKKLTEKLNLNLKNTALLKDSNPNDENNSLLSIFFLGFVGGLLALLTPCVFPMIPLTVSFFTKQSQSKGKGIANAILYGIFIVLTYILLSVPFHLIDGLDPNVLNTISTNIWLNIFFFAILIFFAGSFFGYYEITLPSSWGNKMDSASEVGGISGIFFMALTLAIISFSCTGPILGSLLAGSLSASGETANQLTAGMSGFGFALALPFALFALFPSWLNSLPKSGGWLNTTKVILGFLELAFAFKFLSNSDLVGHWGIFKREIFIGLWMVIFTGLALYLFAKIKFPHDAPIKKLSFSRAAFGVLVLAFVVYLIPGVMKTPTWELNLLSGFPPPQFYSIYQQESECPLGLNCYKDFEKGLAAAKEENKPILLDFTGWACVNCRKMEENVWSQNDIYTLLKEDYILISLYVDDNEKELPVAEQFDYLKANGNIKKIKTYGDKWATFQIVNFKNASQPYYVLLNSNLEILSAPIQYSDRDSYYAWLQNGLEKMKK